MTPALLAMAILAQPECHMSEMQARRMAAYILTVEREFKLPTGLLASVVLAETGGRNVVARGRGKGKRGCDVGVGQIHVPECRKSLLTRYLNLRENLRQAATILTWSRSFCRDRGALLRGDKRCRRSIWGRYNPGSAEWWPKVRSIWHRIRLVTSERRPES